MGKWSQMVKVQGHMVMEKDGQILLKCDAAAGMELHIDSTAHASSYQ